jgi:hypothetical protein
MAIEVDLGGTGGDAGGRGGGALTQTARWWFPESTFELPLSIQANLTAWLLEEDWEGKLLYKTTGTC